MICLAKAKLHAGLAHNCYCVVANRDVISYQPVRGRNFFCY